MKKPYSSAVSFCIVGRRETKKSSGLKCNLLLRTVSRQYAGHGYRNGRSIIVELRDISEWFSVSPVTVDDRPFFQPCFMFLPRILRCFRMLLQKVPELFYRTPPDLSGGETPLLTFLDYIRMITVCQHIKLRVDK